MGLFDWLFGKKMTSTDLIEGGLKAHEALLNAINIGTNAKTGEQARQAVPKMISILERDGKGYEPIATFAARMRSSVLPYFSALDDESAVEQCHSLTDQFIAYAKRLEETLAKWIELKNSYNT